MNKIMNPRLPSVPLDGKGGQADYMLQDGIIYAWSESNVQYEYAWWLKEDGTPIEPSQDGLQRIVQNICRERPFDPEWLKGVK